MTETKVSSELSIHLHNQFVSLGPAFFYQLDYRKFAARVGQEEGIKIKIKFS